MTPDWAEPVRRRPYLTTALVVVVVVLVGVRLGWRADLPAFLYLGGVGALLGVVDVALRRLPDALTLPSYAVGAALLGIAAPFTAQGGSRYVHALIGLGAYLLLYGAQWLVVPSQIGFGDVKLAGVLGLYLGWLGLQAWLLGVLAGFVLGGLYAVALLATRRATLKSSIPYGPFMLAGTLAAVLAYG